MTGTFGLMVCGLVEGFDVENQGLAIQYTASGGGIRCGTDGSHAATRTDKGG